MPTSITLDVVSGYKWSMLGEVIHKTAAPLFFLVLARLLDPDNFGIIAFGTLLINFAQVLWDSGLSKALIQSKTDVDKAAHVVFFQNLFLGILVYALLFLCSGVLSALFGDPRLTGVIRIQGLQIVIASAASVHGAVLQRRMKFKSLSNAKIISLGVSGSVSIGAAYFGWSYWAIVAGILAGETAKSVCLWAATSWRPRRRQYDCDMARQLWRTAVWILLEELLAWFIVWGDSAVVGYYLGSSELGLYRTGSLIVAMAMGTLLDPMVPVAFSALSRLQHDKDRYEEHLDTLLRFFIIAALPAAAALFVLRQPIVDLAIGGHWNGIQPVIACFSVATGLSYSVSGLPPALRVWGHAKTFSALRGLSVCYIIPAYLISISFGLLPFLYARVGVTVLTLILYAATIKHLLGYGLIRFFKNFSGGLVWAVLMAGTAYLMENLATGHWLDGLRFMVVIMVFGALLGHGCWLSRDRAIYRQFMRGLFTSV